MRALPPLGWATHLDGQRRDHGLDDGARLGAHFVIRCILDGVIHQDIARAVHAQRLALDLSGLGEFTGGDGDGGKALNFEPYGVVQTARRA